MKAREDQDAHDVIVSKFLLFDADVYALIDPRSTHSYICTTTPSEKGIHAELLPHDILVTNPIGHSVTANKVYRDCSVWVHDREFPVDLIELPFHEFDVILGMDWLAKHQAVVDCKLKRVVLKASDNCNVAIYDYHSGKANIVADSLSRKSLAALKALNAHVRLTTNGVIVAYLKIKSSLIQQVQDTQKTDEKLMGIVSKLLDEKEGEYVIDKDGHLYYRDRLCVPNVDDLK
ncbi:uncharacterized protein LOC131169369 [Hevea brasiliensis]|uniref:uncharacterized protein LOC131169369 n=1 Tax=Hevea brasiliensis TaxID=3981 RepID=UPI0025F08974|nr:uncharacterized protein LOC131169369 [Hevea brasiliensis]